MIDTAVILATGNPAHQSELIYNRTRTMLPALGKPLVVRVMDRLYRIGIKNFILIMGEQEGNIASYLNTRWLPNVSIEFVLKLTSQTLAKTLQQIAIKHTKPFLIASYNSFTHGNFPERISKFQMLSPRDLIICGAKNSLSVSQKHNYAHLNTHRNTGYSSDPRAAAEMIEHIGTDRLAHLQNLVISDFAACGTDFVRYLSSAPESIHRCNQFIDIINAYLNAGNTVRVARASWVLQIEADADLLTLNRHLLDEKIDAHILSEIPYTVRIREPVRIDPGVSIGQGAIIGPHVYLERGCSVGHKAQIRNAIVLERATVHANEEIDNAIISTRGRTTIA